MTEFRAHSEVTVPAHVFLALLSEQSVPGSVSLRLPTQLEAGLVEQAGRQGCALHSHSWAFLGSPPLH